MVVGEFIFAVLMLLVAILSAIAIPRELKKRNFFSLGFAGLSLVLFGWFSIATIISQFGNLMG
ncbi:DUF2759 domain-containing protein [Halalkalibacillus halophilus]|uniref:DUF2759 domain-containing protein n=1 Tax=Halalkalibacillus halophilus TaxID=392827 RepID=UPI0003F94BC4|nr:DUF2759 domain-containing protein [Halalkalibacillus halophilus]